MARVTWRRFNGGEDGHISHILYRSVSTCARCGTDAEAGLLFCRKCGATLPQSVPGPLGPPPPPPPPPMATLPLPPPPPMPPPAWIPSGLLGRAVNCPRCNSLISTVAVVCPVCLSAQGPRDAAAADAARVR